ncbi:hypothetical protein Tco_0044485 [Tanacetum coccineum]
MVVVCSMWFRARVLDVVTAKSNSHLVYQLVQRKYIGRSNPYVLRAGIASKGFLHKHQHGDLISILSLLSKTEQCPDRTSSMNLDISRMIPICIKLLSDLALSFGYSLAHTLFDHPSGLDDHVLVAALGNEYSDGLLIRATGETDSSKSIPL